MRLLKEEDPMTTPTIVEVSHLSEEVTAMKIDAFGSGIPFNFWRHAL